MLQNATLFSLASRLADHAAQRQVTAAQNIANADTPDYRAKRLSEFKVAMDRGAVSLRQTRAGHLGQSGSSPTFSIQEDRQFLSPNGNSVSIENEMVMAANAQRDHDKALAIYRHGLSIMRSALGR